MKVDFKDEMKHQIENETEEEAGLRNWIWNLNGNLKSKHESDSEIRKWFWFWKMILKLKHEFEQEIEIWLEEAAEKWTRSLSTENEKDYENEFESEWRKFFSIRNSI